MVKWNNHSVNLLNKYISVYSTPEVDRGDNRRKKHLASLPNNIKKLKVIPVLILLGSKIHNIFSSTWYTPGYSRNVETEKKRPCKDATKSQVPDKSSCFLVNSSARCKLWECNAICCGVIWNILFMELCTFLNCWNTLCAYLECHCSSNFLINLRSFFLKYRFCNVFPVCGCWWKWSS